MCKVALACLDDLPNEPEQGLRLAVDEVIDGNPVDAAADSFARVEAQVPVLFLSRVQIVRQKKKLALAQTRTAS